MTERPRPGQRLLPFAEDSPASVVTITVPNKALFRANEVAEIFDISRGSVYAMVTDGRLGCIRPTASKVRGSIRIPRSEVERLAKIWDAHV